jgi:hypothetical protein
VNSRPRHLTFIDLRFERIKEWFNNHTRVTATGGDTRRKLLDLNKRKKKRLQPVQAFSKLYYKKKLKAIVHSQWRKYWLTSRVGSPDASEHDIRDALVYDAIDVLKDVDLSELYGDDSDNEDNDADDDGDDDADDKDGDHGIDVDDENDGTQIPPVPLHFRNHIVAALWTSASDSMKAKVDRYRERAYMKDNDREPNDEGMDPLLARQKKAASFQQCVF